MLGEDCFERGVEFAPERWYERPEMIRNKAAYAPFGTGKVDSSQSATKLLINVKVITVASEGLLPQI